MRLAPSWLLVFWAIAAWGSRAGALQTPARSTRDGVYTEAQAIRGETMFRTLCASCHGPSLLGTEIAPALKGGVFEMNWNGLTVDDLFGRILVSMPQSSPGSLSAQQVADLVAFLLRTAALPSGAAELPAERDVLKQILFEAAKP